MLSLATRYNSTRKPNARKLRNQPTETEKKLWRHIRNKQLGVQFYRQKIIGNHIVDFYSHQARLVIEVDGGQHYEADAMIKDGSRDKYLASRELRVLRFSNLEVLQNIEGVMSKIQEVLKA